MISDSGVQFGLHIVIRLILRVGVGNINFITVTIFSLPIPAPGVCSVDVVDVALFQVVAAGAGAALAHAMAMLPADVGNADQSHDHWNCGKAQEDVEISRIGTWKIN